jgi:very-short-patch-repair endonuclease
MLATKRIFADHIFMIHRRTDRQLSLARRLRQDMTTAETILWQSLRSRGFGWKFRRQVPIGPYVADFVCIAAKLIVEIMTPARKSRATPP